MIDVEWRGELRQAQAADAGQGRDTWWHPQTLYSWTEQERRQFWDVVKRVGCRTLQGAESAIMGLFYPAGGMPVVLYNRDRLLSFCRSQFAAGSQEAVVVVERGARSLFVKLTSTTGGDDKSPAYS